MDEVTPEVAVEPAQVQPTGLKKVAWEIDSKSRANEKKAIIYPCDVGNLKKLELITASFDMPEDEVKTRLSGKGYDSSNFKKTY